MDQYQDLKRPLPRVVAEVQWRPCKVVNIALSMVWFLDARAL
jgi:hypothetical protein